MSTVFQKTFLGCATGNITRLELNIFIIPFSTHA